MDRNNVLKSLESVIDPELGRNIVDLGMVRDIAINDGSVTVTIALTVAGCPMHSQIKEDALRALRETEGVKGAEVILTTMTEEERQDLSQKLAGDKKTETPFFLTAASKTKAIAITSGKGGVGKSSVTVNLALALAERGHEVGILDCDIYGFSVPGLFGRSEKPRSRDNRLLPAKMEVEGAGRIKFISMAFFVKEHQPIIWRGPMLSGAITQLLNDVEWGEPDFFLLDLPPGTGDVALDVHRLIPHSREIIVTTPEESAARVAVRAGEMARATGHEVLGVVENMSYYTCAACGHEEYLFGKGGGNRVADHLKVPVLARIPLDTNKKPGTGLYGSDSPAGASFRSLAEIIEKDS